MPFPRLKLTYFGMEGHAESVRVALHVGGVPFEDERISIEQFDVRKRERAFPYAKLPVLEVDGVVLAEARAMFRFVGRLTGAYPVNDLVTAALCDEILDALDAFLEVIYASLMEHDAEKKRAMREALRDNEIPLFLGRIEARLVQLGQRASLASAPNDGHGLWLHEISIWDYVRMFLDGFLDHFPASVVDAYPTMLAIHAKVDAHPKVQQWKAIPHGPPQRVKLTDVAGASVRGDPVRWALQVGGIAFDDLRVGSRDDSAAVAQLCDSLPYHQLPVLEIDGDVVAQPQAMLRLAGALAGLYPAQDALAAFRVDEILGQLEEMQVAVQRPLQEQDDDKRREASNTLVQDTLPAFLNGLDKRVAAWMAPFATGNVLTVADLLLCSVVDAYASGAVAHVPSTIVDAYASLKEIHAAVLQHPKIVEAQTKQR